MKPRKRLYLVTFESIPEYEEVEVWANSKKQAIYKAKREFDDWGFRIDTIEEIG
jgi:hypothetical protein